jgi:hypothetical protein
VAVWPAGSVATGVMLTYRIENTVLARGVYMCEFHAIDLAGNPERHTGAALLSVL